MSNQQSMPAKILVLFNFIFTVLGNLTAKHFHTRDSNKNKADQILTLYLLPIFISNLRIIYNFLNLWHAYNATCLQLFKITSVV